MQGMERNKYKCAALIKPVQICVWTVLLVFKQGFQLFSLSLPLKSLLVYVGVLFSHWCSHSLQVG